ncbi:nuclease-related domain-containing DEAD/DEAH box helicase [Nocardioides mesophilus]|uniref:NERD domain-containing protein n=1 Tax=Nocardioides mesophilus TaxID=433659 RepID=A0A7G9R9Q8_9ACTN|nr:NERD domain-containing protein [Nocardioides mesophilus]QNN52333.1 NERD domain-containing protein [Nocardioides mesophilus]
MSVAPLRLVPEDPRFTTGSERQVWTRLRNSLPSGAVLLANFRITDEAKDHECDLVVLMPEVGVVVIEVKGGSVWCDEEGWHQTLTSGHVRRIDPVSQARDSKYALRTYVEADPRWKHSSRSRVVWAHALVAPFSDFADDFETPDCPRWTVHGRGDLEDLAGRLWDTARMQVTNNRAPTYDDVQLIAEILAGRSFGARDVNAEAEDRAVQADRLTEEQALILGVTRLLHRVEVRGGAGSGKTVLALAQARELSRGRGERKPQRVALLCYSIGLAEYFKRVVDNWPRKHRPAFVGTFAELGRSWGAPDGDRTDSDFWEVELPATMAELADHLEAKDRFDSIVVDEAQDFAVSWWSPLLGALYDDEEGGLYIYSDENQRIFARFGRPPVPLVPLVLDHNLRNTKQIHAAFGPLAPSRMYARGSDGPAVRFVAASADAALGVADDEVERLLDDGWRPENVMLLTTGHRHPVQIERTGPDDDQKAYWRTYWANDDVFYGHVLGCKGLERRAVVLCVNKSTPMERGRERLYVGMSRATDVLVVVGDPDMIREMGGDAVAKQLGI